MQPAARCGLRQRHRPVAVHGCALPNGVRPTDQWFAAGGSHWLPTSQAVDLWCSTRLPLIGLTTPPAACPLPTHAAAWALQRIGQLDFSSGELKPAAAGLRTLVVPSNQLGSLADLAWSLSQHPRTRFAVCINAGLDIHGGSPVVADVAAMLSGVMRREPVG